jgi:hypothetical protein
MQYIDRKTFAVVFSLTLLAGVRVCPVFSQETGAKAKLQQQVAAIKEAIAQNHAALKEYTWTETTQISLKGEVKKQEQKQCRYGPDGKVEKTPIGSAPAPQQASGRRGGRAKEHVVEKKVGELKDYMESVAGLVKEYVPPDPEKIKAAAAAGNISMAPSPGIVTLAIKDYLKPQDSVTLGFDTAGRKISTYQVLSYLDNPKDDPVTLNVTFAALPDRTGYPQQTVLDAEAKQIRVTVSNSNYTKLGQ